MNRGENGFPATFKYKDEICKRLDYLFLRKLELMQDFIKESLKNERFIKEGYLHVAKARYIMGTNSVSVNNLPNVSEDNCEPSITVTNYIEPCDEHLKSNKFELLDRKGNAALLKRFGVLTPQSLKQAQTAFNNSLEHVAILATIRAELENVQNEFKKLSILKLTAPEKNTSFPVTIRWSTNMID